jgi:dTDP-4-dehydrorhamnose 3,5-epimerase-like enzyme
VVLSAENKTIISAMVLRGFSVLERNGFSMYKVDQLYHKEVKEGFVMMMLLY